MKTLLYIIAALIASAPASSDEIFKCEQGGHVSYQRTSCADASQQTIDRRYANVGRIGPDADSRAELASIRESRQMLREDFVKARANAINARVEARERREGQCEAARAEVKRMYLERRYRRIDSDSETDLLRRAREACAP